LPKKFSTDKVAPVTSTAPPTSGGNGNNGNGNSSGNGNGNGATTPGTPSLLREMNVRAALALLIDHGPLSRAELARLTGLSKVTAGQLLARLSELGLAEVVGARSGARGPNADVHGIVASAAYVVGVDVGPTGLTASACDLLGREGPRVGVRVPRRGPAGDPTAAVAGAVEEALAAAGAARDRLHGVVIGVPGLVAPDTGDVAFSFDLPRWGMGVRGELESHLGVPVTIDNDVSRRPGLRAAVGRSGHRLGDRHGWRGAPRRLRCGGRAGLPACARSRAAAAHQPP
jgi:hypothetical protein